MKPAASICLAVLLASTAAATAQPAAITPEQIGQIFCIGSLGNDMAPVQALLTPDLAASVRAAETRNAQIAAAHPDEKPPLGDGLPWRTWQDYADGCTVGAASIEGDSATVVIDYAFSAAPDANYADALRLKSVDVAGLPAWRIDDIELGEGATFRTRLTGAFDP